MGSLKLSIVSDMTSLDPLLFMHPSAAAFYSINRNLTKYKISSRGNVINKRSSNFSTNLFTFVLDESVQEESLCYRSDNIQHICVNFS